LLKGRLGVALTAESQLKTQQTCTAGDFAVLAARTTISARLSQFNYFPAFFPFGKNVSAKLCFTGISGELSQNYYLPKL
jgi:hypothetical protein